MLKNLIEGIDVLHESEDIDYEKNVKDHYEEYKKILSKGLTTADKVVKVEWSAIKGEKKGYIRLYYYVETWVMSVLPVTRIDAGATIASEKNGLLKFGITVRMIGE